MEKTKQNINTKQVIHVKSTLVKIDSTRYLGVHLDTLLNFYTHVKENQMLQEKKMEQEPRVLTQNLSHCSDNEKEAAYTMFIWQSVELAS